MNMHGIWLTYDPKCTLSFGPHSLYGLQKPINSGHDHYCFKAVGKGPRGSAEKEQMSFFACCILSIVSIEWHYILLLSVQVQYMFNVGALPTPNYFTNLLSITGKYLI